MIVIGTITDKQNNIDPNDNFNTYALFTLKIEKTIKGDPAYDYSNVKVRIQSYKKDNDLVPLDDDAYININDRILVFLTQFDRKQDIYIVTGGHQGLCYLNDEIATRSCLPVLHSVIEAMSKVNINIRLNENEIRLLYSQPEELPFLNLKNTSGKTVLLNPQISQIYPPQAHAGPGSWVMIVGSDFGETQGEGSVRFCRNNVPPLILYDVAAYVDTWTDDMIIVNVPYYAYTAVTGPVRVYTDSVTYAQYADFEVTFSREGSKWGGESPNATYYINPGAYGQDAINAIEAADETWNEVQGHAFSFSYDTTTDKTQTVAGDGTSDIIWRDFGSGYYAALTYTHYDVNGFIDEKDTEFNSNTAINWSTNPNQYQCDIQANATHELGHWLGLWDLKSSLDNDKVMYYEIPCGQTTKRFLQPEDEDGIRYIYPETGYRVGITNDYGEKVIIEYKSDSETYWNILPTPSEQTIYSYYQYLTEGQHIITIRWTDPITETLKEYSQFVDIPAESLVDVEFTIPCMRQTTFPEGGTLFSIPLELDPAGWGWLSSDPNYRDGYGYDPTDPQSPWYIIYQGPGPDEGTGYYIKHNDDTTIEFSGDPVPEDEFEQHLYPG